MSAAPRPRLVSSIYAKGETATDTLEDRQARAETARRELWHGQGLAVVDPEDFEWPARELIITQANRQYGKRGSN